MYDWANSAFATTVIAGLLPIYFASVIVPPDGWILIVIQHYFSIMSCNLAMIYYLVRTIYFYHSFTIAPKIA